MRDSCLPLPVCITGQAHRSDHKSILLCCTLPFFFSFFLSGYFGNSFVKGREKISQASCHVDTVEGARLRKNSTAVPQFVCLSVDREGLQSDLLHFTLYLCVRGSLSISGFTWGSHNWCKSHLYHHHLTVASTPMAATDRPSCITESAIAVLIFPHQIDEIGLYSKRSPLNLSVDGHAQFRHQSCLKEGAFSL